MKQDYPEYARESAAELIRLTYGTCMPHRCPNCVYSRPGDAMTCSVTGDVVSRHGYCTLLAADNGEDA